MNKGTRTALVDMAVAGALFDYIVWRRRPDSNR